MISISPLTIHDRADIQQLLLGLKGLKTGELRHAMQLVDMALDPGNTIECSGFCSCLKQGDFLGFICFGPLPMTNSSYGLYWIAVDKKHNRWGVGSELLLAMEEYLSGRKGRRIYVDIPSAALFEPARSFCEKHGYQIDSVLNDFYRSGDDKIIYRKEIEPAGKHPLNS